MAQGKSISYPVLAPNLQVSFYYRLQALRDLYLQDALKKTVECLDIKIIDNQLVQFVQQKSLKKVASFGLRGEVFFPVPYVIETNPFLLGYYRLLFGLSQKEFYYKGPFNKFKKLEDQGEFPEESKPHIIALCNSLVKTSQLLVEGIDDISLSIVHDLQILTLGPLLRGSENTRIGQDAIKDIISLIKSIVGPYIKDTTARTIIIENESGRTVLVEFLSDPDVRITEKLPTNMRPLVSMEIKGGTDASNIHNRLGEAEKSHQKAKNRGFFEFWTIIRVDMDYNQAKKESPTTSHFFHIDRLSDDASSESKKFRELLGSLMGIRT
jgi:hypothetical protein